MDCQFSEVATIAGAVAIGQQRLGSLLSDAVIGVF
jgi:hypothetical protein